MKKFVKPIAALLALAVISVMIAGCGGNENGDAELQVDPPPPANGQQQTPPDTPGEQDFSQHVTIDVFNDYHTGFVGTQPGWFGQVVDEKFNMTLNHIGAPDGEFEMIFQTRAAAGNLGDLVFIATRRIPDAILSGLLTDITDMVEGNMPTLNRRFPGAVDRARTYSPDGTRIYGVPGVVSAQSPFDPALNADLILRGPYFRFDAYMGIGAPTINTLEDMLPVLAAMVEYMPYTETGNRTWGLTMWSDWDGGNMAAANWFNQMYGMNNRGVLNVNESTGHIESLLDPNGIYKRALRLLFNANQMGLIDPDSPTQSWDDAWVKSEDGAFMFSWYSFFGAVGFNSPERLDQGIGYAIVPIMDQSIRAIGISPNGGDEFAGIGPSASDVERERIIAFIDWMYSSEGNQIINTGPYGLTWEIVNGEPVPTEFGFAAGAHDSNFQDAPVPDEWGGGTFSSGEWFGRVSMILRWRGWEINENTGFPYDSRLWPFNLREASQMDLDWMERFEANSPVEFLMDRGLFVVAPGFDFTPPEDPSELDVVRREMNFVIAPNSWRMIFAPDEATFDAIWEETVTTAYGLGWADLVEFDRAWVADFFAAQDEFLATFGH